MGGPSSTIRPTMVEQPVLITVEPGAPRVHISSVRLLGRVLVNGGDLVISDCTLEHLQHAERQRRRLDTPVLGFSEATVMMRALSIAGGRVVAVRSALFGHTMGAVHVSAAYLLMIECMVRDNRAKSGGAVLVEGEATVHVTRSELIRNTAELRGGAMQVLENTWSSWNTCSTTAPGLTTLAHTWRR